jgi:transketolase C-terminal domain/subunit
MHGERAITGAIAVAGYPPQPHPHQFGEWWKQLVAVCAGLATVGIIVWAIGKQFFVTRDEWIEIRDAVKLSAARAEQTERIIHELRNTTEKLSEATAAITLKLTVIEAQVRRR